MVVFRVNYKAAYKYPLPNLPPGMHEEISEMVCGAEPPTYEEQLQKARKKRKTTANQDNEGGDADSEQDGPAEDIERGLEHHCLREGLHKEAKGKTKNAAKNKAEGKAKLARNNAAEWDEEEEDESWQREWEEEAGKEEALVVAKPNQRKRKRGEDKDGEASGRKNEEGKLKGKKKNKDQDQGVYVDEGQDWEMQDKQEPKNVKKKKEGAGSEDGC